MVHETTPPRFVVEELRDTVHADWMPESGYETLGEAIESADTNQRLFPNYRYRVIDRDAES